MLCKYLFLGQLVRARQWSRNCIHFIVSVWHRVRLAGRAQSSLASACFLREGAWSRLSAGGDGAIAIDPSHGRPPKTGPVTSLRHTVASGSFTWPPPPEQNWIFWPELPLSNRNCILVAGRPLCAAALSSCNCPRTGFVPPHPFWSGANYSHQTTPSKCTNQANSWLKCSLE